MMLRFACYWPLAALLAASIHGCAATPLERALEERAPRSRAPLPRAVAFRIQLDEGIESLYGTRAEWQADILRTVETLDACARIVPESLESKADLVVTIHLSRSPSAEPDIQSTGAFLDFLAWSTIPLLPLWIPDVDVEPELHVQVTRSLRSPEGRPTTLRPEAPDVDPVSTSYLDRRPFISWQTLGAILVPPFVFSGSEPQHVEAEIGAWVREATAVQVASLVRASQPAAGELLDGLVVQDGDQAGLVLRFTPRPGLRRVVARVDEATVGQWDVELAEAEPAPRVARTLPLKVRREGAAPEHVSVLAIGSPGQTLRYTVRVPREALAPSAPGGGMP